jgi:cytochrome c
MGRAASRGRRSCTAVATGTGTGSGRTVARSAPWARTSWAVCAVWAVLAVLALGACGRTTGPEPGSAYRTVPEGDARRGAMLLSRYQCGQCHAVPDAPSNSLSVGPPLDRFGKRSYIAGRVPNLPGTLQRWLEDPQALVPGTTMPDVGVSPADARDMAAHLLSLR